MQLRRLLHPIVLARFYWLAALIRSRARTYPENHVYCAIWQSFRRKLCVAGRVIVALLSFYVIAEDREALTEWKRVRKREWRRERIKSE